MQQISTKYEYCLELLETLVNQQHAPSSTTLIICWERNDFSNQLLAQTLQANREQSLAEVPSSQPDEEGAEGGNRKTDRTPQHAFLTPTLRLLAASKHVNLVFCPTVPMLRAYLASLIGIYNLNPSVIAQLVILDLLALHHGTSEFTLQGLSRTFASAVSAAHRTHSHLTLVECKDMTDPMNPHRGPRLWNQEVPLLSGSVKIGQEGARWAGRSFTIRKIAGRWFTFEDQMHQGSKMAVRVREDDVDEMLI